MITSNANEKVKQIEKLGKSGKLRKEEGVFLVEGIRMFREVEPSKFREIYYTEDALAKYEELDEELSKAKKGGALVEAVSENVMKKMTATETPQGILAVVRSEKYSLDDLMGENPFILILEHIQDPGNLGTMIRMAEGAGATGLLLSSDCADYLSPKAVRSTMGAVLRMKIVVEENLVSAIRVLKEKGVTVYGTHLLGKTFYEETFTGPCAFLIGNEGNGLSEEVSREADKLIRIPMMGKVESLNAAISATVVSYEVLRQRH